MIPTAARSLALACWQSWVKSIFSKKRLPKVALRPWARLRLEELETRLAPANYSWTGNAGTLNWGDANNWSGQVVPVSTDDVTISKSGVGTITISADSYAVRSLNDTTAGLSIVSGASLSLAAVAATSTFGQNVNVQSGATLAVGAGGSVLLQASQTLTVSGAMTLATGDTLTLSSNYPGNTQVVVNGTFTAAGSTINQSGQGYTTSLTVNSGGELIASGSTFALSQLTLNAGSVFNPGDLSNDNFNLPIYVPANDVALLSAAGGGSDNKSFQDINILAGTLASGSTLNLNAIGTQSTANLRFVFPGNFTVANGATLNVGANVPMLIQPNVTLTDDGTLIFANGDSVNFNNAYATSTQIVVGSGGVFNANGASFTNSGSYYNSQINVASGGELIASGSTFALSQLTLNAGSVFNPGDLSNDNFNLPIYIPASDVALLSAAGGGSDNKSFQDINIFAGTLASGSTLNLNAIGTQPTANLRFVFPGNFTVANGATLNVGANVPMLIQPNVTLTDDGTLIFANGDSVNFNNAYATSTQIVVGSGGVFNANGASFTNSGSYYNSQINVASGGELIASGSTFALSQLTLNAGSVFNPGDLSNDNFNLPIYIPASDVALLSAAGGGSDNKSFQDINIFAGTLASGSTLNLNAIGTQPTANLRFVFPGNFTVANGATLNVGANVPMLIQPNVTLTDDGTLIFANGDSVNFNNAYATSTQIVVGSGGVFNANGASFTNSGSYYNSQINVASGGELIASGSTFALSQLTLNAGSVFNPGDLSNDNFNLPIYIPASDVALLSAAGGGSDNKSFQDINIFAGTLASGSTLNLNAIGTQSTANLRFVFPGNFTVANGATLNVGANVPMLIQPNVTLTDDGTLIFANGDSVNFNNAYATSTQIVVGSGGVLNANGASFTNSGSYYNSQINVASGGELIASGSTFALSQLTLNAGSVFNPGDLSNDNFNLPIYIPASDVALLSAAGGGSDNKSFQDINIFAGTLASGSTLNLNAIGTQPTANLRFVFPGNFTVANGATLNVGANVPMLIQPNVTLTDDGTLIFANGDSVNFNNAYATSTQIVVGSGGVLNANGASFTNSGSYYNSQINVASGGELIASGSTFALSQLTLNAGSVFNPGDLSNDNFNLPIYIPASDVALLSAAGGGSDNKSFQDINIFAGTLASGSTLNLNAIGTQSTANLRFVFPGNFTVANGATLNVGANVPMLIQPNVTLTDDGTLIFANGDSVNFNNAYATSTQIVVGSGGVLNANGASFTNSGSYYNSQINVASGGELIASGSTFAITHLSLNTNSTVEIAAQNGVTTYLPGAILISGQSIMTESTASTIQITGNLLATTTNGAQFKPQGTVILQGAGTSSSPQMLEAMSADLGSTDTGFNGNFAYGTLIIGSNNYVKLVNQSLNSPGSSAEAVYANSLVVPSGSTLNLNGMNLYVRDAQIAGTITGGSITQIPDSGPITVNSPAAGQISVPGELDNWTFFGQAGTAITVAVDPGSGTAGGPVLPHLQWAQVQLLDPSNNVLATASGTTAGAILTLNAVTLPADGSYTIAVKAASSHTASTGNYVVAAYNVTPNVQSLNVNQTINGTVATPYSTDQWTFSATANAQVQFNLLAESAVGLSFSLTGPSGYSGFTNIKSNSTLITLPASGTYTLTAQGTGGAVGSFAFALEETAVTGLTLNSPYQGTLAGDGQAQLFTVTLTNSTVLNVGLADSNANDQNEVYVSLGSAPTRDSYQYKYTAIGANQSVVLLGRPGTYYILVYNNLVTNPGSSYTLDADGGPFTLSSLTPGKVGNTQPANLLVSGIFPLAYQSATPYQIQLVSSGGTVYPASSSPLYLSPTSLSTGSGTSQNSNGITTLAATLPANTLPGGTYSVRVTDSLGDTQTLANALTVTAGGVGVLKTSISTPNPIGYHEPSIFYVTYRNIGTAPMPAPLLVVTATQNGLQGAFLSLNSADAGLGYWTNTTPAGFSQTVQFLASGAIPGILEPGEAETVPIYYGGWLTSQWDFSRPPITFSVGDLDTTNTQTIDWSSLQAGLRPGSINQTAWNAIYPVLITQLGTTWGQYVQQLDSDAVYLAGIGEPTNDLSQLLSFEIEKANASYTAQTLTSVTADDLPAPGMDLTFVQSFQQSISGRYSTDILGNGWTTNWNISASTMSDGDVAIDDNGISEYFSLQPNGSFAPEAGDQGTTLTVSGGADRLVYSDGTVYQFNVNGTLSYVQDIHGNRITAGYNGQGQMISLTDSNGEYLDLTYKAQGHLATLTDSNGQTETYGYDPTGQFLTSYTNLFGTTNYTYVTGQVAAQDNALASITNASGTTVYFAYDSQGRLIDQHENGGAQDATITYLNPGGYVTTDANGNQTTVYFNLYGASAETIDALGNVTRNYYDSNLNLTKVIGPGGATYAYTYGQNGNFLSETDPLGLTTSFTYNNQNDLTSYTDAKGNTTSYAYNSANDLLSITYANGTKQQYAYNPLGEATQFVNANGQAIGYTYNADGLVATETFADGTSYSYAYDVRGNLTSATDAQGNVITFVYGNASNSNLLTKVEYPDGTWLQFSYNVIGQRTQSVDQTSFTVNYTYDLLGRLSELTDGSGNLIVLYTYDNAGNLIQKNNGNGTYTVYTYDGDGNVLNITNYAGTGGPVNSFDIYTYDALGNVLTDTSQDGEWVYTYDADSQLIGAVFTPNSTDPDGLTAQNLQYAYDSVGNRLSETVNGVLTTYLVNDMNEYTSSITVGVGTTTYQYDNDGNMTAEIAPGGTTNYTFNQLNQLTAVNSANLAARYVYDPLGNRIAQTINGTTTNFQIDPAGLGNVVATYASVGGPVAHYTYGLGLVSQVSSTGVAAYYDFNNIGSTVGITNSNGNYVNEYSYVPFGVIVSTAASLVNPFEFVGQWGVMNLGNGMQSMRARSYNPATGQFLSSDPLGLDGGDSNIHRYAANNPITFLDPLGLTSYCFSQQTGQFVGGTIDTVGYAGGYYHDGDTYYNPLPTGTYTLGDPLSPGHGPFSFHLNQNGQDPRGWGIHGANSKYPDASSQGCIIIANPNIRKQLNRGDTVTVVSGPCPCDCPPTDPPTPPDNDSSSTTSTAVTSQDPNSMEAPAGYGTENFVADTSRLPYQINFENAPTASAPAQRVDITDQLNPNLDWSTFQLTALGFGSTYITIPAGLQHYDTSVPITENGQTFDVVISLNLNPATGVFTASFQSIDPDTDLPPTSLLTGFLPPEDGSGNGTGFVSFTVEPNAGLPTGTQITNVADITFDLGDTIATDQLNDDDPSLGIDPTKQALVTIDSGAPTSNVAGLPPISSINAIPVNWSGTDDAGGSGVASYTVYVSDNSGLFMPWLINTTQTSGTYVGLDGHTYGFYSVATDNVGNVQPTPTVAEATTTVDATPPSSSVAALPTFSPATFTLDWSGTDDNGVGIASYSVYVSDDGGTTFTPLLTDTTQTSTTFTGVDGDTYGFYSIAMDNLGNVQPAPSSAQASTMVDATAPTSTVAALPASSLSTFTVNWSGSDNADGSGLASYSVYVSDDNSLFTLLLGDTTQTFTSFTGQYGHTYGFYSVATDSVGNVQPTPNGAQATTTTQTNTALALASDNPSGSTYGQSVTFTATLTADNSEFDTPTGSVQFQVDNVNLGSPVPLSGGVASVSTAELTAGNHTITAIYTSNSLAFADTQNAVSAAVNPVMSLVSTQTVKSLPGITTGSVPLATFTVQTGLTLQPSNFAVTINWQDGSALDSTNYSVSISGTQVQVFGTHTYNSSGSYNPVLTLTYAGTSSIAASPTINVGSEVTSSVSMTKTAPVLYTGATNTSLGYYHGDYRSTLTIKNTSNSAIDGSLMILLSGLAANSPNVTLQYATVAVAGVLYDLTITYDSSGDPVVYIPQSILSNLAAGSSLAVSLWYYESTTSFVTYTPKMFSDPYDN